jgi:hypothetical protein
MRNVVVVALVAICSLPVVISGQSNALGPGPFTNIRLTEKGDLLFTVRKGGGKTVAFAGTPRVSVATNVDFVPVDGRAVVRKNGQQLLQKGAVNGVSLADYFVEGEQRRIAVRNGDGATTELDVVRQGDGFLIPYAVRSPRATSRRVAFASADDVSVGANRTLDLRVETDYENGEVEAVVAVTLPPLPEGIDRQSLFLEAVDVETSARYSSEFGFVATSPVVFFHLVVPEGTYELVLSRFLYFGNPEIAAGYLSASTRFETPVRITRRERVHGLTAPDMELPAFVETRVIVEGLDQLEPSTSSRVDVRLSLVSSGDFYVAVEAPRSVSTPGPLTFDLRLPEGPHAAFFYTQRGSGGDNGTLTSTSRVLGEVAGGTETAFVLPELAEVPGALLDSDFVLASGQGAFGIPQHHLSVQGVYESQNFSASGTLGGFARGFGLVGPRGSSGTLRPRLVVKLGEAAESARENDTGTLSFRSPGEVVFGTTPRLDVAVPALPSYVTVTGRVSDEKGNPVKDGFVSAAGFGIGDLPEGQFSANARVKDGTFRLRLLPGTYFVRVTVYDL